MADDQWIIVTRGVRMDVWNIGVATPAQIEDLSRRARFVAGVAADDFTPHAVMISPGQPHARTLLAATVHEIADLTAVSQSQMDAYRAAQLAAGRQARIDAAADQVTRMPAEDQAALRTRLGWNGGPRPASAPRE